MLRAIPPAQSKPETVSFHPKHACRIPASGSTARLAEVHALRRALLNFSLGSSIEFSDGPVRVLVA